MKNTTEKTYMNIDDIIGVIKMLSASQGFYGRIYHSLMNTKHNSPEDFEAIARTLEGQKFTDAVDVVMFLES